MAEISVDARFHCDGIDLMVVTDGVRFAKPWLDPPPAPQFQKTGTLVAEFGGLYWQKMSGTEARYQATKVNAGESRIYQQRAVRVYPA